MQQNITYYNNQSNTQSSPSEAPYRPHKNVRLRSRFNILLHCIQTASRQIFSLNRTICIPFSPPYIFWSSEHSMRAPNLTSLTKEMSDLEPKRTKLPNGTNPELLPKQISIHQGLECCWRHSKLLQAFLVISNYLGNSFNSPTAFLSLQIG